MGKDAIVERFRFQSRRCNRGRRRDKSVDDDNAPCRGGGRHRARHHGDFKTAKLPERFERARCRLSLVDRRTGQHVRQHEPLVIEAQRRRPRTRSDEDREIDSGQYVRNECGGAGVTDADLAVADDIDLLLAQQRVDGAARVERRATLFNAHRRFAPRIARAVADPAIEQKLVRRQRLQHSGVNEFDADTCGARQDVDAGAARKRSAWRSRA